MTENLKIAIENIYEIFAKYQGLSKLEGSPLYRDIDDWNKALRSKKLRELSEDDLSRFVGKVILTWGDENDFRYYLPRILELTAQLKTPYDIRTLYSRLEIANWKDWDIQEQKAINDFTIELWNSLLTDNSDLAEREFKDYFHAIANFYPDFNEVLKAWESIDKFVSVKHLTNYVFEEHHTLFAKKFLDGMEKNRKNIDQFKNWLTSEKIILKVEQAFFENETDELAEKLSWVEQILINEKNTR
ncbi:MAG: hypothetical protein JJU02_11190 [Cryomorphaceae bacterium]|nr:hypothetical protein [Cryomorphaceae bacterium]